MKLNGFVGPVNSTESFVNIGLTVEILLGRRLWCVIFPFPTGLNNSFQKEFEPLFGRFEFVGCFGIATIQPVNTKENDKKKERNYCLVYKLMRIREMCAKSIPFWMYAPILAAEKAQYINAFCVHAMYVVLDSGLYLIQAIQFGISDH